MATATAADILIHQSNGPFLAAVEVKNRENLTVSIAMTLRISQIKHGVVPEAPYFFMVSQDHGYLWRGNRVHDSTAHPDSACPMGAILDRYMPHRPERRLSGAELESVIFAWLTDLALTGRNPMNAAETELEKSGFISVIHNSVVSWGSD